MKKLDIYIQVTHLNFWWGYYGFCNNTSWEDMIIYRKWGKGYRKLAWSCICTKPYFERGLDDLKDDPDEKEFVAEIIDFLECGEIRYHYYYDKPNDADLYEVPYEAKRDDNNIKPSPIETWYPCNGVDKDVLSICARAFCKQFLGIEVESVELNEVVSFEDALNSYIEHIKIWEQNPKIVLSDSVIEQVESKLKISKERVLEILNRSIK